MLAEKEKCTGCWACYNVCPKDCIEMEEDAIGFRYPVIDKDKCINCKKCEKCCPPLTKPQSYIGYQNLKSAWGGKANDETIRSHSSSGGIFSLLASNVIDKGGIVYGAALTDNNKRVKHIGIEHRDELAKLRGSKYVQSDIGDSYKKIKQDVENGRFVLFSGTPCQIQGLNSYLGREYKNLITIEVICHGVPAPAIYRMYIDKMAQKLAGNITKVVFRDENGGGYTDYED